MSQEEGKFCVMVGHGTASCPEPDGTDFFSEVSPNVVRTFLYFFLLQPHPSQISLLLLFRFLLLYKTYSYSPYKICYKLQDIFALLP